METPEHQYENQQYCSSPQIVVLMVPFPAHSHLNQLLELSHVISSHKIIQVHYISSPTHNSLVKSRSITSLPKYHLEKNKHQKIQFHDFPFPPFLSPPLNPNSTTKFPQHLIPSFEASMHLRKPFSDLLRSLSPKARRVVIIHDALMASVVRDFESVSNSEAYAFHSISAFTSFTFLCEATGQKHIRIGEKISLPVDELPWVEAWLPSEIKTLEDYQTKFLKSQVGELYNTCRAMEGNFVDRIMEKQKSINYCDEKKIWAVGPLNPISTILNLNNTRDHMNYDHHDKCLEWLEKQEPKSVLYVSFGTTITLSNEEIRELALGLEQSGTKFIWVLREADKGDSLGNDEEIISYNKMCQLLPLGFEERVDGIGMVVREWVPQVEILGHPAIGGFMNHCGWNSCVESVGMGVPMIVWPMHSDQPRNAVLIVEVLKVGFGLREWVKREKLVSSSVICEVVTRLMESNEGNEMRKRAQELGRQVRKSTEEGGVTRMEQDSFISHITR